MRVSTGMSRGLVPGKLAECSECYGIGGNYDSDEICASALELNTVCVLGGGPRGLPVASCDWHQRHI